MNRARVIKRLSLALDYISASLKSYTKIRLPYKKRCDGVINVLATGPSLNEYLSRLKSGEASGAFFVMNDFALSDAYMQIKPRYYIMVDPAYFMSEDAITDRDRDIITKVFGSINDNTTWEMELIIPSSFYGNNFKRHITNKMVRLTPVNFCQLTQVDDPWYYKMLSTNKAASFSNVLGAAIYVCVNLGYSEIRLYGADHSWTNDIRVNDQNQVCTVYRHFYEDEEELVPWRTADNKIFEMHQVLQALASHFLTYKLLNKYARMKSCKIINCTPGSYIDAFERS